MKELFDLSGRSVVVTGSSRGIGLAIARAFLAAGASVVVNGLDRDETARAVAQLGSPDRLRGVPGDVSTPEVGAELVEVAASTFGKLDHIVCNAGIDIVEPAIDYSPDEWDRILDINLRGAFLPHRPGAPLDCVRYSGLGDDDFVNRRFGRHSDPCPLCCEQGRDQPTGTDLVR